MSTILYMVTDGDYSDYHVVGVYSTRENAELAKTLHAALNDIETIELDALLAHPTGHLPWQVTMDVDGNVDEIKRVGAEDMYYKWSPLYSRSSYNQKPFFRFLFVMWATDEEHAVKIAGEYRRQVLHDAEELDWNDGKAMYAFWMKNTGQPVKEPDPTGYDELVALNKKVQNENS